MRYLYAGNQQSWKLGRPDQSVGQYTSFISFYKPSLMLDWSNHGFKINLIEVCDTM
jgi:hypothetical protein